MKEVTLESKSTICIKEVPYHGNVGIQLPDGSKYIGAQVDPGTYRLFTTCDSNVLNRRDDDTYKGVENLIRAYLSPGAYAYLFDTAKEALEWLIS